MIALDTVANASPSAPEYDRLSALSSALQHERLSARIPERRLCFDPDNVKQGLGKLVLTLVELIRELLERQAIRRMESGSLSPEEIERLGITFLRLAEEMDRLKQSFGLDDEDLNLDLGPLGKLL